MTERKQKTLMRGIFYDMVLKYPDEIHPYHSVYFIDHASGLIEFGLHEKELFDVGMEIILAYGEIFEPELMKTA